MTQPTPAKTAMPYAPAHSFHRTKGLATMALDLCETTKAGLTGVLPNIEANVPAAPGGRSYKLLVEEAEKREKDNLAYAEELLATCRSRGIEAEAVTAIDHSRGLTGFLADHARLHDVIITGTGAAGLLSDRMITECLLFEAGRPLLLVPGDHSGTFAPRRIVAAWDNSRTAARALGDALALLPKVEEVILLVIGGEKTIRSSLDDGQTAATLAGRGLVVSVVHKPLAGRRIGDAIQQAAGDLGADLLVMGGCGHSRLRDFILGGATMSVLDDLRLPTLMAH